MNSKRQLQIVILQYKNLLESSTTRGFMFKVILEIENRKLNTSKESDYIGTKYYFVSTALLDTSGKLVALYKF